MPQLNSALCHFKASPCTLLTVVLQTNLEYAHLISQNNNLQGFIFSSLYSLPFLSLFFYSILVFLSLPFSFFLPLFLSVRHIRLSLDEFLLLIFGQLMSFDAVSCKAIKRDLSGVLTASSADSRAVRSQNANECVGSPQILPNYRLFNNYTSDNSEVISKRKTVGW